VLEGEAEEGEERREEDVALPLLEGRYR